MGWNESKKSFPSFLVSIVPPFPRVGHELRRLLSTEVCLLGNEGIQYLRVTSSQDSSVIPLRFLNDDVELSNWIGE